jgi:glycosyltransferase involved in cell wall biosynthesis
MSNRRLIIATSIYPPDVGGPAVYFASLKEALEKRGREVKVMARPGFFSLFAKVRRGDMVLAHATPKVLLPVVVVRLFKRFRFAVRIGGDFFWERAMEEGRFWGTLREFYESPPRRCSGQGIANNESRHFFWRPRNIVTFKDSLLFWLLKKCFNNADSLIFTSPLLRDIYIPLFGLDEKKCRVIFHSIESLSERQIAAERSPVKKILYAGRFLKLKNLDLLLEVFASVRAKYSGIALILAGMGPQEAALREKCEELHLVDAIQFKKPLKHDIMLNEIASSDLVVLPSLSEVSPNLLTDAISAGTPFLATRENGLREKLEAYGEWFDPVSMEDFKDKLEKLLAPGVLRELRSRIKSRGPARTWDEVAEEYEQVMPM